MLKPDVIQLLKDKIESCEKCIVLRTDTIKSHIATIEELTQKRDRLEALNLADSELLTSLRELLNS